jgi:hypothetical protein
LTPVAPPSSRSLLEDALRHYMAGGITLTEDVRRFMEATFGDASVATLQALLSDESGAERDSLMDLIFFPDPSLQIAIEPILENHCLTEGDVTLLAAQLKATPVATTLHIPGTDAAVPTVLPVFLVDTFLARLNIPWQPTEALTETLTHLDARPLSPSGDRKEGCHRLRVLLRNAALRQTPVQVRFLCDFFECLPLEDQDFVDKLTFMLVFMKEHEDSPNIYQALMDRKKFIFQHLLKTRRSGELAARTNMETLIMTGVRTPYFDVPTAEKTLVLIDRIAMAVFGRTECLDGMPCEVDLGHHAGALDPEDLIHRLS